MFHAGYIFFWFFLGGGGGFSVSSALFCNMSLQWLEQLIGVRDRWSHCVTISPISGRALAHTRQSFCFSRVYTEERA